eukprot:TRINITY_DN2202_c0_g1_i1.p1 TRINITY_DN2202_c0_g1~~TRINITY_DN2202_c0_g1_i1.p1  ORF type:complete len:502 (-),score=163.69 TRINITY_DN2202_c0_g1_i1:41-1546(-)
MCLTLGFFLFFMFQNWCFEPEHFSRPEWQEQVTKAQNANDDNYNNSDKSNNADSTDDTIIAQDLTSVFENLKLDDGNEKMDQNENEHDDLADIDIGIKTQPLSDESSLKDIQAPHHHEESTVIPKLTEIEISIGSEKDNKTVAKYHPTPIIPRQIQINEAPQAYVGTPIVKRSSSKLPSTPSLSTLNKRLNDSIWFRELERLAGAFVTKLSGDVDSCMRVTNFFVLLCSPTSVMDLPRLMIRKLDYEMVEGNDPIKEHEYERFQFFAPDQSAPEILLKVGPFDDLENATKFLSNWKQSAREGTSTLDWKEVTNNKIEDDEENEGILEFKEGEDTETMKSDETSQNPLLKHLPRDLVQISETMLDVGKKLAEGDSEIKAVEAPYARNNSTDDIEEYNRETWLLQKLEWNGTVQIDDKQNNSEEWYDGTLSITLSNGSATITGRSFEQVNTILDHENINFESFLKNRKVSIGQTLFKISEPINQHTKDFMQGIAPVIDDKENQ